MAKKKGEKDSRHMVGIVNRCRSARFILLVDGATKTYDISTLNPNQVSFHFSPKGRRKIEMSYEVFDSMDDLHQGISELAKGFKENKTDHIHCWEGGKEHVHEVDKLGLKIGKCSTSRKSCDGSQKN